MTIGIWQLLIVLLIVVLIFGAKRLRSVGGDLGTAIKGFKDAMREGEKPEPEPEEAKRVEHLEDRVYEGERSKEQEKR